MISKELKRLNRRELVDIIYQLKKNEQELQNKIESQNKELEDKRIRLSNAGSIAEAALSVTNVFSAAQTTADLYLREIASMKEETEKECIKKIADAENKVKEMLANGEKKLTDLKKQYENAYAQWRQLQLEIAVLSQTKTRKLGEEKKNG